MVGQRTLTPLILVRIQVKQPIKKRPVAGVFLLAEKPLLNGEGSDSNRAVVIKTLTEAQLLSAETRNLRSKTRLVAPAIKKPGVKPGFFI